MTTRVFADLGDTISIRRLARRAAWSIDDLLPAPRRADVTWLFIATLPNSGSTALAQVLLSSPRARTIEKRGEGQWLVDELSSPGARWNPDLPVDWARVRHRWLRRVPRLTDGPIVVVEKSPPNLCRFRALLRAFSDMRSLTVRLTRDPYAVCASWTKRYAPEVVVRDWAPHLAAEMATEADYYRALGSLCGARMAMLASLEDVASLTVAYETLTTDPQRTAADFLRLTPELGTLRFDQAVAVKDYESGRLRNMNGEQIAKLGADARRAINEGLAPYESAIAALGYRLT